jgi:uncharacterized membrane protein YccC
MISDRYTRWVAMLASSDRNLVLLAGIALGLVVVWHLTPRLPAAWAARLRHLFLISTLLVAIEMITQVHLNASLLMVGGVLVSIGLAAYRWVGPRVPAEIEP